jgi:hypothetical protein
MAFHNLQKSRHHLRIFLHAPKPANVSRLHISSPIQGGELIRGINYQTWRSMQIYKRTYEIYTTDEMENIELYKPGGIHPVTVGVCTHRPYGSPATCIIKKTPSPTAPSYLSRSFRPPMILPTLSSPTSCQLLEHFRAPPPIEVTKMLPPSCSRFTRHSWRRDPMDLMCV